MLYIQPAGGQAGGAPGDIQVQHGHQEEDQQAIW